MKTSLKSARLVLAEGKMVPAAGLAFWVAAHRNVAQLRWGTAVHRLEGRIRSCQRRLRFCCAICFARELAAASDSAAASFLAVLEWHFEPGAFLSETEHESFSVSGRPGFAWHARARSAVVASLLPRIPTGHDFLQIRTLRSNFFQAYCILLVPK